LQLPRPALASQRLSDFKRYGPNAIIHGPLNYLSAANSASQSFRTKGEQTLAQLISVFPEQIRQYFFGLVSIKPIISAKIPRSESMHVSGTLALGELFAHLSRSKYTNCSIACDQRISHVARAYFFYARAHVSVPPSGLCQHGPVDAAF
jgi:hypothetical protein